MGFSEQLDQKVVKRKCWSASLEIFWSGNVLVWKCSDWKARTDRASTDTDIDKGYRHQAIQELHVHSLHRFVGVHVHHHSARWSGNRTSATRVSRHGTGAPTASAGPPGLDRAATAGRSAAGIRTASNKATGASGRIPAEMAAGVPIGKPTGLLISD